MSPAQAPAAQLAFFMARSQKKKVYTRLQAQHRFHMVYSTHFRATRSLVSFSTYTFTQKHMCAYTHGTYNPSAHNTAHIKWIHTQPIQRGYKGNAHKVGQASPRRWMRRGELYFILGFFFLFGSACGALAPAVR